MNFARQIEKHIVASNKNGGYNITGGRSGHLLLTAYNSFVNGTREGIGEIYKIIDEISEGIHNDFTNGKGLDFSYAGGITGAITAVNHVCNTSVIEEDIDDVFDEEVQRIILKAMQYDMDNSNYELLYGYIGKGIFLLEKKNSEWAVEGITKIIKHLNQEKRVMDAGYFWTVRQPSDKANIIDLGLAHGIPSITSFCCRALPKIAHDTNLKATTLDLIYRSAVFLISKEQENTLFKYPKAKWNIPIDSSINPYYSRLGWCYGDLCIALTLFKASAALENNYFETKAKDIMDNLENINIRESGVKNSNNEIDPSFCHGAAGVAYILHNIYSRFYKNPMLEKQIEYWMSIVEDTTSRKLREKNLFSELSGDQEDLGLLYGYTGIGLTSLSLENDDKEINWQELLLI